jgi:hypothetical protein
MAYLTRAIGYTALADYDAAWNDVHQARRLHAAPNARFITLLTELSGRSE